MHLRLKVFLIVGVVLLLFFVLVNQALLYLMARDFSELEQQEIQRNTLRVADAVQSRIDELSVKLSDWSQWDDTYEFMGDYDESYVTSNLQNESFGLLRINTVVIVDVTGGVIFKKQVQQGEEKPVSGIFLEHLSQDIVKGHIDTEEVHGEIITLPEGPMVYVARPITSSNGLAPTRGFMVFGYFLDQSVFDEVSRITHLEVQPVFYSDQSLTGDFSSVWKSFSSENRFFIETPKDEQKIAGDVLFRDADNQPVFFLRVLMDREIYRKGQDGVALFQRGTIAAFIVFSTLLFFLLNRLVLHRLSRLSTQVEKIGASGNSQGEVHLEGNDEFSSLADQINKMLEALRVTEMNRKESEKRFRTLADSAPVLIWMTDSSKRCIYVNRGWLEYTGRALEKELGEGFLEDIHVEDRESVVEIYERAFAGQKPFSLECRLRRKDGTYGWVFSRAVPHFASDSIFLGYIGSCVDITERKESENQNKNRIEEVEKMNRIMVERELKMIELKEQIKKLQGHA